MFQLAFHLPYYALRSSPKAREDHRQNRNGFPLRQCQDVSFLDWASGGSSGFLYEAQYSCLIAGTDETRWVAYAFVDNYYDAEGEGKETVMSYHEDSLDEDGGLLMDPLTFGTRPAHIPIWNPRRYFLVVLDVRLNQASREWQQIVAKIRDSVREYVSSPIPRVKGREISSLA
jgi:hypothetical protein